MQMLCFTAAKFGPTFALAYLMSVSLACSGGMNPANSSINYMKQSH